MSKEPITTILGQKIHCYPVAQIHQLINKVLKSEQSQKKLLLLAMNLHILLQLNKEPPFRDKHAKSGLIFADGVPLVWLSKLKKQHKIPERVSGTDLTEYLLNLNEKVFLIAPQTIIAESLSKIYPNICGFFVPPFAQQWPQKINQQIVAQINQSGAKILLVAVGPLKQEKWLIEFLPQLKTVRVAAGIGSALEILVGNKRRAPAWMQSLALEWLWRIILEPKRLLKRYLVDVVDLTKLLIKNLNFINRSSK